MIVDSLPLGNRSARRGQQAEMQRLPERMFTVDRPKYGLRPIAVEWSRSSHTIDHIARLESSRKKPVSVSAP